MILSPTRTCVREEQQSHHLGLGVAVHVCTTAPFQDRLPPGYALFCSTPSPTYSSNHPARTQTVPCSSPCSASSKLRREPTTYTGSGCSHESRPSPANSLDHRVLRPYVLRASRLRLLPLFRPLLLLLLLLLLVSSRRLSSPCARRRGASRDLRPVRVRVLARDIRMQLDAARRARGQEEPGLSGQLPYLHG